MGQDLFSARLLSWFDQHGRHNLPWQQQVSLYRVWVSEIMLQQTQVSTVIPYYARFMQRFPDIASLAEASQDQVLHHWAGLGYYARGRNLHRAAQIIVTDHNGQFPQRIEAVNALPGIGRSTAGAILALSLNQRQPILDGNVKRSLCRYHGIEGFPGIKKIETQLWALADQHTPFDRPADYTQAIMDMGAILCTRSQPDCKACPHQPDCIAFQQGRVKALPTPRPKRIKPKKHRFMLVLSDTENNVVTFKRPDEGIWGGLHSLPEFNAMQQCREFISQYGQEASLRHHTGIDIKHSFTHFDLSITPVYLRLSVDDLNEFLIKLLQDTLSQDTLSQENLSQDNLSQQQASVTGVYLNQASKQTHQPGEASSPWGLPAPIKTILKRRPEKENHYLTGSPRA